MLVRYGERVTLSDGTTPVLRDFHNAAGAFVEHNQPVPRAVFRTVNGKREHVANIGPGRRAWVQAPGYREARDRDGCRIGIIYTGATPCVSR